MDPIKKLIDFLDKILSQRDETNSENIASSIVHELEVDPDDIYSDLTHNNTIVAEISSIASDLEWSNGKPAQLEEMWDRLEYLHTRLKAYQNPSALDTIKAYTLHKIKQMAALDSRLNYSSSLLQSLWPDATNIYVISDDKANKLAGKINTLNNSHKPFDHEEIRTLHKAAESVINFAARYGCDENLQKAAHYINLLTSQDTRISQIGWDLEEYIDWYFDQAEKKPDREKRAQELLGDWKPIMSAALQRPAMLRDYQYNENWRLLDQAIEAFIDLPDRLSLVGFTVLSPDSFLWKIFDGENVYYLYAEDFVSSLDQVTAKIRDFWPDEINLEFMPVKEPKAFEDSSPNKASEIYQPPENEYEFTKYAWPSGYDFVFLLKSSETIEDYIDK